MATTITQKPGTPGTPVSGKPIAGGVWTEVSQKPGSTATPVSEHSGVTGYTEVAQK